MKNTYMNVINFRKLLFKLYLAKKKMLKEKIS